MRAFGPYMKSRKNSLGRSRVGVGELAAVRTGDVVRAAGGRGESREPVLVGSDGVLRREDDEVARREPDADVAGAPVAELLGRYLVDERAQLRARGRAPVGRARVDDDDLDRLVDHLAGDRVEAADEVGTAVLDGDDDRDHGDATSRNWYAKSEGRTPATAWATRSTAGVPRRGTGAVWSSSTTR